ncbi:MAG: hypothetical protein H6Q91_2963, partial [Deltaproteobacteria bacterium]|nr:hypothetical protein [Deltaproteobacteria bacterium]
MQAAARAGHPPDCDAPSAAPLQTVQIRGGVDTFMLNTATPIDAETTDVSFA